MDRKGILLVISGFAGSGKGTIVKKLLSDYDNYVVSVSATTRNPRPGEEDGREYFFLTREKFDEMIDAGEFLEYAHYVSNSYGTPKKYVEEMMEAGKDVILEIECQGALQVKKMFPGAVLFFVTPPDVQTVYDRLHKRGTETEDVIMDRMRRGMEEAKVIDRYDYLLVNDDLELCVETLHNTVNSCRFSINRSGDFIDKLKSEFVDFLEGEK